MLANFYFKTYTNLAFVCALAFVFFRVIYAVGYAISPALRVVGLVPSIFASMLMQGVLIVSIVQVAPTSSLV